jgi:peptidoglycan lytic transglycosylase D
MRLANGHFRTVALAAFLAAACGCQTAQKPVALVPPGTAPALHAAAAQAPQASQPDAQPAQTPAQKSAQKKDPQPAPPQAAPEDQQAPLQKASETGALPQDASAPDPVADLIERAEKEYQAGLANHQAGKTEDARQNFDKALNELLGSNLDIRSDDRLAKEFDRIVEGVDEMYPGGTSADAEPQEAQQGQQQKVEPAPIDETNSITPSADASTKVKAQLEIKNTNSDLPLMMTDQVAGYIAYFSGPGRGVFERAYSRSGRYHDMIVDTLKQQGLPQDLIYLAQAESGFHPLAVSRAGARGIWQFMASRGRGYGLRHNMWVDDRQDPEKSTRAAARHLKELYAQFGDWYLAMAAYNSGPGTVQSAVKRTGYADFWELYRRNVLPHETRNYVPIILDVTIMAKNPEQYGLDDVEMESPPARDTVTLDYPVDLHLVAQCTNSTIAELLDLNPSLLRLTTPRTGTFDLHLPAGTKDQYETTIAAIPPDMRLWWRYHTVHEGDTLASLAHTYHVTAKAITAANHLDDPELETDARLIIPIAPGKHPTSDGATYARHITWYHVHRGDTVESVAENFGVAPQMLRRWNGLRGSSLAGRRALALHLPITPTSENQVASSRTSKKRTGTGTTGSGSKTDTAAVKPPATKSAQIERLKAEASVVHHKVRSGETLYSIAQAYKTTVAALKRDNKDVAVLHPGMILVVQTAR